MKRDYFRRWGTGVWLAMALASVLLSQSRAAQLTGEIVDARTGRSLSARLYLEREDGARFFAESRADGGAAIPYARTNWFNPNAIEFHTTLPATEFVAELPPGRYTLVAERGKEYFPAVQHVVVTEAPTRVRLELRRWANLAARGWYSGDTHVHRSLAELPTLMLAEDLNVALPQTYWVTKAFTPPSSGDRNQTADLPAGLIRLDPQHVIWPRNTEYELFYLGDKVHNLGAVFIQSHHTPFTLAGPPMRPIAAEARRQGALLDLDKHDWSWALMLVPVMQVDLFGLVNNHLWRTEFGITNWVEPAPAFMNLPNDGKHGTERDWLNYGCQSYYALLNCGFRLRPTAGSASGVHPVPLGFGRVYVHCPGEFSYEAWIKGLGAGRSFVTTGPMLLAEINGEVPGGKIILEPGQQLNVKVRGTVLSEQPVQAVELVKNGEVQRLAVKSKRKRNGAWSGTFSATVPVSGTTWLALRCWEERDGGRVRFAHTAPTWLDDASQPLRPRRAETDWLVQRMQEQIARNQDVLPPAAVEEYRQALAIYQELQRQAR